MMTKRTSVWIAAAAAAVMGVAAGAGLSSRQEASSDAPAGAPVAAPPNAIRSEDPSFDQERSARQMALLGQELAAVRAELAAVRSQVDQARAPAEPALQEDVEDENARRAEGEAMHQARVASVDSAFRSEPRNPRWAEGAGASIRDALAAARIDASRLRNLECRTRTCRIELTEDEAGDFQKALPLFAFQLAPVLPELTADHIDDGRGGRTAILYLSANP